MTLAIYGPGGFGREIACFARRNRDVIFISDSSQEIGRSINGIPVLKFDNLLDRGPVEIVIAVADSGIRRRLAQKCEDFGIGVAELTALSHERGDEVHVQPGGIFCGFTSLTSNIRIGKHFHANIYSYVGHDCIIGDFVTLAPNACINGNIVIEDDVYIGTGAVLKQGTSENPLRIAKGAVIGMGAVVTESVPPQAVVVGNPGRQIRR